jgi:hypothetical protein
MKLQRAHLAGSAAVTFCCVMLLWTGSSFAQSANGRAMDQNKGAVIDHWTKQRRDAARPRDLLIGPTGQGYLRRADGSFEPYGRQITAEAPGNGPTPLAGPRNSAGSNDTTPPSISNLDPAAGAMIGASYTFSATVTDDSGIRSVSFIIRYPDGVTTQSFSPSAGANNTWSITLQGFFDGSWSWQVQARDTAKRGGNTATTAPAYFSVDTGGTGGGSTGTGSDTVTDAQWIGGGGTVDTAAGRLYFEMPSNAKRKGRWTGYVCSGTAVSDGISGRSTILTAAHCVYDDANKAFARNVLFIPDQAATSGSGTDLNCDNDPLGCWVPSFGVVDANWATRTFPDNVAWDYGYYAVSDSGAHAGATSGSEDSLEAAAGALVISFLDPAHDLGVPGSTSADFTDALGYSYSDDPKLMYCAENMTTQGADDWWLASCGLSGGSSGGPWMQPVDSGDGPIISINSWGYTDSPGMAGPKLSGSQGAQCVLGEVTSVALDAFQSSPDGDAGETVSCSP